MPQDSEAPAPTSEAGVRTLLAELGTAMIATGQPVHEIEEELAAVARGLGYPDLQVGAGPTSITLTLARGQPATFEKVTAPLRLDQAADVRRIRHEVSRGRIGPARAVTELDELRRRPPRYPRWTLAPALVAVAVGIATILQPGWPNLQAAAVCALAVVLLVRLAGRWPLVAALLPVLAAFVTALLVLTAQELGLVEGALRTILPPIAPLLPGALIVTGMSEVAAGHMQAGSARLVHGLVQLALFALGIVAAMYLLDLPTTALLNVRVDDLGWWGPPVGLVLITVGIGLMESVPARMLPWVLLVLLAAYGAQVLGQHLGSLGLGGFLGAVAASLGATFVELLRPELARLVVFLPAFWLLVPGSLGLVGVSQLVVDPLSAVEAVLAVVALITAIALGLLVGSALGRSLRIRLGRDVAPA
jgi:uncharacterized membrane protein YjjP (DUF1212 family)